MASSRYLADLIGFMRGLQKVGSKFTETQVNAINHHWQTSSFNQLPQRIGESIGERVEQTVSAAVVKQAELQAKFEGQSTDNDLAKQKERVAMEQAKLEELEALIPEELKMPPITEAELQELAKDIRPQRPLSMQAPSSDHLQPVSNLVTPSSEVMKKQQVAPSHTESTLFSHEKSHTLMTETVESANLAPDYPAIYATGVKAQYKDTKATTSNNIHMRTATEQQTNTAAPAQPKTSIPKTRPHYYSNKLEVKSKESAVPSNRLSRVMSFGSLGLGLGMGAIAEATRRTLGLSEASTSGAKLGNSALLSDANMERIVSTLCRVRGAALKLGQMLSIQDNSMLSPQLQAAFERVRQSADFMPTWQMEKAMADQLGPEWRSKFKSFDDKPFAAASIGQVHRAALHDGQEVAVKIQYPGVAKSIDSDIDNLLNVLKWWQVLPKGMYAENVMDVSRHELAWECDYIREAKCMKLFRQLLADDHIFHVPYVYEELSTDQVLVTELIPGVPLDKCVNLSQETRDVLGENLLRLCLTELYDWNIMQTDPNWSNFFYDDHTEKVYLLDFGATRQYSRRFVDYYIEIIKAAAVQDRERILDYSKRLGFLTGYESQAMVQAHVDAVTILGGPCGVEGKFDFGQQEITKRIENIIPVMLKHRLGPPPEETYSLHRKLSGSFLLCARLKSKINVKKLYDRIFSEYEYGKADTDYGIMESLRVGSLQASTPGGASNQH